ncbi:VCBS domain-containing protein [Acinetobacter sp. CWB-B33]|uniref:VCBS domain-containing protein n=1 Tax=Acinetobacter sp. CWB-B33 TaxID=2815724 RepID=UPI0031FEA3D5
MLHKFNTSQFIKILFTGMILSSTTAFADETRCKKDYGSVISKEMTQMSTALNSGNYQYIADKSDSSIIELAGGQENYNAMLVLAADSLKKGNIHVEKVDIQPPQNSYIFGKKEFCVIPKQLTILMNGKAMTGEKSFMLAVRSLESQEWKYIDGTGFKKNPDLLYTLFPEIPHDKHIIPE